MMSNIFEKVNKNAAPKKDRTMIVVAIVTLIVVGFMFYSVYFFINYFTDHNDYILDLADSFIYAKENDSLEVYLDGEKCDIDQYTADYLFIVFDRAWVGRPSRKETHDDHIMIYFGDGSSLMLAEATLRNIYYNFVEQTPSFYGEYTDVNNKTYIFKNYRFPYSYFVRIIKGEY